MSNTTDDKDNNILTSPDKKWSVVLTCSDCRKEPPNIVEDFASGDLVCGDCGLVLGDRIIDTRSEWRTFANDEGGDPSRVGSAANPLLDGDQLDTLIAGGNGGSGLAHNLNRIQGRTAYEVHGKVLAQTYKDISSLCEAFTMSKSTIDIAKGLYRKMENGKLQRGRNNDAIIAGCILLACRQDNAPRSYAEICKLTKVNRKDIGRTLKFIKAKLGTESGKTSSNDLIGRFCSNLGLDQDTQRITNILAEMAKDIQTIAGKSPVSIASACIYMASHLTGNSRDANDISKISGVGGTTIKTTYKVLYQNRNTLLTPEIMREGSAANESNLIEP
ncbi:transcription initiation factor IIB [Kickxella alabastrina]|uniref:Transcription initiation factor IIB n=1 Tax=Kickxella alabastrina TaxID=61397 RepID=A0ACC1IU74_9FUNG|nr:transcription initiation factor IIB [Kickxella alabastrina]